MSSQRAALLNKHFSSPRSTPRPILTSLNGDTTWLISLPRPAKEWTKSGKAYFHIVTDPWLFGDTFAIHPWLMTIKATISASAQNGDGVDRVVWEIEQAAAASGFIKASRPTDDAPGVDAIFLSIYLPDHLHEPTLRSFDKRIPVVASPETAKIVNSLSYFDRVITTCDFDSMAPMNWPSLHAGEPLSSWINIFRLNGHHEYNFAYVMMWTIVDGDNVMHEAIVYSPHGIKVDQPAAQAFSQLCMAKESNTFTLAILHGLKESFTAGGRNTLGVAGGLDIENALRPRYWIKSHDAVVKYSGFIGRLTRDYARTLMDGLKLRNGKDKWSNDDVRAEQDRETNFKEIENGESFVLV